MSEEPLYGIQGAPLAAGPVAVVRYASLSHCLSLYKYIYSGDSGEESYSSGKVAGVRSGHGIKGAPVAAGRALLDPQVRAGAVLTCQLGVRNIPAYLGTSFGPRCMIPNSRIPQLLPESCRPTTATSDFNAKPEGSLESTPTSRSGCGMKGAPVAEGRARPRSAGAPPAPPPLPPKNSLVQGAGFRVQGSGFRVHGSGFRVQG